MSIAQDIISRHDNIYDARDALREEITMRDRYNMEDGPEFAELVDALNDLMKRIAEHEYAIMHQDNYEPDYEDMLRGRDELDERVCDLGTDYR